MKTTDKQRLDWLDKNSILINRPRSTAGDNAHIGILKPGLEGPIFPGDVTHFYAATYRQVIDLVMKSKVI